MKKYWKQIVFALVLIAVLTYIVLDSKEHTFKRVDLKTSNLVLNMTDRKYLDTILVTGLNISKIDSTAIIIRDLPEGQTIGDLELRGSIFNTGKCYLIFIKKASREESIKILSHELIHYRQYYDKRLFINDKQVIWEGKDYSKTLIEYDKRPWEIEAFLHADELEKKLKLKLY